jgi:glycosyltransferase involved in cell wall biosynthesis
VAPRKHLTLARSRKPGGASRRVVTEVAPAPSDDGGPPARRRAIFTIVSCNYVAYAATLMQSVRDFHPEVDRFIVLADTYREFPGLDTAAELMFCDEIGIELIANMQLWYTVIEFNTAIKPFVFRHLFDHRGFDEVVYLDPDILLFHPLTEVFDGLAAHNIVLIPHMMQPLQDGKEPSDLTIMKSGVYNLGFLGVRNDPDSRALIGWWSERCYLHCRVDVAANMFTDQRWMDLAPAFLPNPLILRHPGYNVAYWNLAHRRIEQGPSGSWMCDGGPLVFFHFSGVDPEDPSVFSKHQNRFTPETLGSVAALCDLYRALVLANGWAKFSRFRYGFAAFLSGRRIENAMRRWFRRAADDGRIEAGSRLVVDSRFFDQLDEEAAEQHVRLTRFMYQFWLDRRDLRAAFDVFTPRGYEGYLEWFLNGEARRQGVDGRSIAAARRLIGAEAPDFASAPVKQGEPPWPPVSRDAWQGPACKAGQFLQGDVTARIGGKRLLVPAQVALVWEVRGDLQAHFKLDSVDDLQNFLAWALTNGVAEGGVNCEEFSPAFLRQMAGELTPSSYYRDVPITVGLVATRFIGCDNPCYAHRQRFPVERAGRLAHGLWFSYAAAKRYKWPRELVAPLVAYFEQPTGVVLEGFPLTNAMLAIRDLREDVQKTFLLDTEVSISDYVLWLLTFGLREMDMSVDQLGAGLRDFLLSESPRVAGVERIVEMLYCARSDLQEQFDITTEEGRNGLRGWWSNGAAGSDDEQTAAGLFGEADAAESAQELPVYTAKVALTGQWSAPTGRGEDVRCSAISLQAVGFTDWIIVDSEKRQIRRPDGSLLPKDCRVEVDLNILHTNADTAHSDWRLMQTLHVSARMNVGFWAWELERLPSYWRYAFSFFDEIWASTRFAEEAFRHEQLRPVRLMPMAVISPEVQREASRRELGLPEDATVFLFVFDFRSFATRKNPKAVVRAFLDAFPSCDEEVFLVIKTMGGEDNPTRLEELTALCDDPRISLRDIKLDRDELIGLTKACDAFVSLHRSEGFGRGPAEAMLLGRATIVTGYSGTNDFATGKCAYLVDYELVPVEAGEYMGVEGQRWADANIATAARHMRAIHEKPADARRVGKLGRAQITRLLTPPVIGARMHGALMELFEGVRFSGRRTERKLTRRDVPQPQQAAPTRSRKRRIGQDEVGVA